MSAIIWDFQFRLRSKNSSGTVLHTYKPASGTLFWLELANEEIVNDREDANRTRDNVPIGFYRHYLVSLERTDGHFAAYTAFDALETVLAERFTLGNTFELTLNGENVSPTWVKVYLDPNGDSAPKKADGSHNTAVHRELEFVTCALLQTDDALDGMD